MILLAEHDEPSLAAKKKQRPVALEKATSPSKNRVWNFFGSPLGQISFEPDLSAENAIGSVQYSYKTASGQGYYYTRDHLGSVREMLNSSGSIVARYQYDPYGRATLVSGTNLATFQYTNDYFHAASGLSLTMYRAYDPNTGRWLSRDPIKENGGIDLYEYCKDDPIWNIDSLGLKCTCAEALAEKSAIIAEAQRWNKTAPPWNFFSNDCGDQAIALIADLYGHGLGKCWSFSLIGGRKIIPFIVGTSHNEVEVDNQNTNLWDKTQCPQCKLAAQPFTLDPYAGNNPFTNNGNVGIGTPFQFYQQYPVPYYQ